VPARRSAARAPTIGFGPAVYVDLPPIISRLLVAGALLGGVLVIVGSLGDVAALLTCIPRRGVDLPLFLDCLTGTRHASGA
jgi:hypothetical protein